MAWGGVGKTALVVDWMARMAGDGWRGAERVFDWSFYSQGTSETATASSDAFIAKALEFFGDPDMAQSAASPWDKGSRLAQLVAQKRTLLVLDGVEPLQHPPGPVGGKLKDPGLEAMLKGLAHYNPGLCILTTRESVADLKPYRETTSPEWLLEHLSEEAGAYLLFETGVKHAGSARIRADDKELKAAAREVGGHALTLQLLGRYLAKVHNGDVRKRTLVRFEKADAKVQGGHAFKTMAAYEQWLRNGNEDALRQLAVLHLLGLFDRPAASGCLNALRKEPAIAGLTEPLIGLTDDDWNYALSNLVECGLISCHEDDSQVPNHQYHIDCHPLIREYFAKRVRDGSLWSSFFLKLLHLVVPRISATTPAWRAAHWRLYKHLCATTKEGDKPTLEDLQPLYQAVAHGCRAGLFQSALDEVFMTRIRRDDRSQIKFGSAQLNHYSIYILGAFSSDVSALSGFVDASSPDKNLGLDAGGQAYILNEVGSCLRAVGRLSEALGFSERALRLRKKMKHPRGAESARNLAAACITFGILDDAVDHATEATQLAALSSNDFDKYANHCWLGRALHLAGKFSEAERVFGDAMHYAQGHLVGLQAAFHCDLLIDLGQIEKAIDLAQNAGETNWERDNALCSCVLAEAIFRRRFGCTFPERSSYSDREVLDKIAQMIEVAFRGLQKASRHDDIPTALLVRARLRSLAGALTGPKSAQSDLDEAWEIAERGPMRLHMADIHLYRARLFHGVTPYPWDKDEQGQPRGPKDDLAAAEKLIKECGYHRRDGELADAWEAAKNW